jgi:hypothetical protein
MATQAKVMIDSIGYKPFPKGATLEERRVQMYASHGETVELEESEFKRLKDMGAVAKAGSKESMLSRDEAVAAAHLGPAGTAKAGPPLPGQTGEQIAALVENRADAAAPGQPSPEQFPTVASADSADEDLLAVDEDAAAEAEADAADAAADDDS